ncbi:uncharacterized protein FPRO_05810 [Fusarium proliferatum ET1]|uniref:Uncharacterized protein n=1 Tax=Fusarium proliferatum (strain ET1) TaxID=1227346 RepID=A0A1L7VE90_FUSPR|nr:uncharacterized protein FPRO_05810 [Fusarium proliferatum ET1]CZR38998.1 uncharacterized protein FPRO_05810 [Fusarium proliferatum ET1]
MSEHSKPGSSAESSNDIDMASYTSEIDMVSDTSDIEMASDASGDETSPIEKLPPEVLSYALSFLPDRASIRAAMLSGSKLYNAFKQRPAYITSCVLFNSMEEPVYREAVVTFNMKMAEWQGLKAGIKAINRVYSSEQQRIYSQFLTLDRVKKMWRLHKAVEYFAKRLPSSLIKKHPVVKYRGAFSINTNVRVRFQRALYRLDACLNIMKLMIASHLHDNHGMNRPPTEEEHKEAHWVHCLKDLEEHRILKAFHSQYSAVEIEQLTSICGILVTEIAPSFNTFLERDIELGTQLPYYISHALCPGSMSLIAQGLPFLKDFLTAGSRIERARVMRSINPPIDWNPHLPTRPPFPGNDEHLTCVVHDYEGAPGKWARMDTPDFMMRTPFIKDPDPGPENAWHILSRYAIFLNESDGEVTTYQSLPWGYVFWDIDMFDKAEFINIRIEDHNESGFTLNASHPIHATWQPLAKWDSHTATDRLLMSCQQKVRLKNRGQTGYFNYDSWIMSAEASMFHQLHSMSREDLQNFVQSVETPELLQQFLINMEASHPDIVQMAIDLSAAGALNALVAPAPDEDDEDEDDVN